MSKFIVSLLSLCFLLSSCENMTEKELEDTISSGVVLVQNQSYYEVVLSNGESIFFSSFDAEGDLDGLALDKDSVEVSTSYGTGFFISGTGEIVTNSHVVSNVVADKEVNKQVGKVIEALKAMIAMKYSDYEEKLKTAQEACEYAFMASEVTADEYYQIRDIRDAIKNEMEEYEQMWNNLDKIRASDSEIKYHNEVSIAYNNTYVTNTKDFVPCVVTKTDMEHDLAIIQLKDKSTP